MTDAFAQYAAAVEAAFETSTSVARAHADADEGTVLVCANAGETAREAVEMTATRFSVTIVDATARDRLDGVDYTVALSGGDAR